MTPDQVKAAVAQFEVLQKELSPLAEGFGLQGLVLTVGSHDKLWECSEVSFHDSGVLVLTHKIEGTGLEASKWSRTFLDPSVVISVEFEVFPEK